MSARNKYFPVVFENGETVASSETPAYQWDKGVVLLLSGIEIPNGSILEANCYYDSQENSVTSAVSVQDNQIQVSVPDIVMAKGVQVFATVQITKDDSTITIYEARLPLIRRAKPHDYEMSDSQKEIVDQLISAVNEAMGSINKFTNLDATLETIDELEEPDVTLSSTEDTTTFDFVFPTWIPMTDEEIDAQLDKLVPAEDQRVFIGEAISSEEIEDLMDW